MSMLKEELSPEDLERLSNAIEGFASAKLSPELTGKLMQLQTAVEAGIISPEKSAEVGNYRAVASFWPPVSRIWHTLAMLFCLIGRILG